MDDVWDDEDEHQVKQRHDFHKDLDKLQETHMNVFFLGLNVNSRKGIKQESSLASRTRRNKGSTRGLLKGQIMLLSSARLWVQW